MRPAARLRSPPRCINHRADRKRRGSRSRHGASCPRCLAAVLCPGRAVSGLRPAKFCVLYNSAENPAVSRMPAAAELQGGFHPYKTKFCATRPRAPSSAWFAALLTASPMPAASPSKLPPPLRCRAGPRSAGCLRSRASARCSSGCAAPALGLASDPAACALFCFAFVPSLSRAGRRGGKTQTEGGRCQTRSRERFPDVVAAPAQAKGKSSSGGTAAFPWLFCGASPQKWQRSTMNSVITRLVPSAAK